MSLDLKLKNDCIVFNTAADGCLPSEFTATHHVHILVRRGGMTFSDGHRSFAAAKDDLVIWQMSNRIQNVEYSGDFEADCLLASGEFVSHFNPEMVWASKGFVFIRTCPVFHLENGNLQLIDDDFTLFRSRLRQESPFRREVVGRVMQLFLYDLWTVYEHGLAKMDTSDRAAQLFLRFLGLVQANVRTRREVAFYADKLCVTSKYLSEISRAVTGIPASQWIGFYATYELVALLDDNTKSVTDIADAMEFSSIAALSAYTKKLLGRSPSEYRQK